MFDRTVQVYLDKSTFPKKKVPAYLSAGTVHINMLQALLMLGSVTVPGGTSVASPAIFWAWVRYLSALATHSDLRVTTPFTDLDPHQKTILSDDFGVAVTTQWLSDCVGGFQQVVDGRRFILNYAHLMTHRTPSAKKTGPRKAPDFVVLDAKGKWHVIECKGTQTSITHSIGQLGRAQEQKGAIAIKPTLKGTSLAAGLYLASENSGKISTVTVYDPRADKPLIRVQNTDLALRAARRVTTARYLALAGFPLLALEAADAPTKDVRLRSLFNEDELVRSSLSEPERIRTVSEELNATRHHFVADGQEYFGREVSVDIPWVSNSYEPRRVTIRQGVWSEYIASIRSRANSTGLESLEATSRDAMGDATIAFSETGTGALLRHGTLFAATLSLA
jgi:hypothetical protein